MAEAITNHLATERGLSLTAQSAGTMGGSQLNPVAVQAMNEIGISMEGQKPKLITQEMVEGARVISMGCGVHAAACPAKFILTEDWELDDPAGQPIEKVRQIRDQIYKRVEDLLEEKS